jgi:UDP-glucose 4-epimerase
MGQIEAESVRRSDRLSGQKVLVTGASGFLGSHLCRRLREYGAEVHAVSRSFRSTQAGSPHWWQADMAEPVTVGRLLRVIRPEVIFHLSGLSTASPHLELVWPTLNSLLISTVNLLTAVAETGCDRLVLLASLTEPQPAPAEEAIPGSPYAAAKWASSAYGRMFHRLYGTPAVIVRPFMTYGPGQDTGKLIPYVILSLLKEEAPKLSSGRWRADWIYVDDVIDGLLAAARSPDLEGCTVDLGSGVLMSVHTVVQYLVALTGSQISPLFGALPDRPSEPVRTADTAYASAKLGWKATIPLQEGLKRTVDWYALQLRQAVRQSHSACDFGSSAD